MTIKEIINKGLAVSEVGLVNYASCITVGFINKENVEDEVQLTVENHIQNINGVNELSDLFNSLTKELNCFQNSVTSITIVATAKTKDELEAMGY